MLACSACEGFVPDGVDSCPNCRAARSPLRKAAGALAGAALMMTLMACYGAPGGVDNSCHPTRLDGNGNADGTTTDCDEQRGTCEPAGTPLATISYYPTAQEVGRPGKLTVTWKVIDAIVADPGLGLYVIEQSPHTGNSNYNYHATQKELKCLAPSSGNTLTIDLAKNEGADLVIAGARAGTYSKFRVTTSFVPTKSPP